MIDHRYPHIVYSPPPPDVEPIPLDDLRDGGLEAGAKRMIAKFIRWLLSPRPMTPRKLVLYDSWPRGEAHRWGPF